MRMEARLLQEARLYASKHPHRVVSADCHNYPSLNWLYRYATWVRGKRRNAKQFSHEGVRYAIVLLGDRLAVLHIKSGRVLVRAPGDRNE